jgi:hypothetical protein
MRLRILVIAIATIGFAAPAGAQQAPCRSVYLLGEAVPAHCRAAARPDLPAYQQWGAGNSATASGRSDQAPPLFDRRFQGGYNSAYGLGR